jgi:hypothetical protein
MTDMQLDLDGNEVPWKEAAKKGPEPVELQITRHHAYEKGKRGCAVCERGKFAQEHLGASGSLNFLGSGNQFAYQAMKKGWAEALTLALEASGLSKNLNGVLVEGVMCFPDRRRRDQGNHRFIVEKALGGLLRVRRPRHALRQGRVVDEARGVPAMTLTYDPRHPHEPEIPPALDAEGRCLVCGLMVRREEAERAQQALRRGVGALVATTRCYKRPKSKLDYDPGPCGGCAVCLAKQAFYGEDWQIS